MASRRAEPPQERSQATVAKRGCSKHEEIRSLLKENI